jgi:demethylmenaquinone methyltransferase/2-methoxy-6-polyprenyl-1,4-benzoquinol methylase
MSTLLRLPRGRLHSRAALWLAFFGRPSGPVGWVGARVMPFVSGRLHELMATELDLHPDDDLLDVGCGSGAFLQYAAPQVHSVAGIDASEVQVAMARHRLRDHVAGGTAELVLGDAQELPWNSDRFSAAASLNCLKFVADPDRALAEMCRVLRAGGRCAVLVDPEVPEPRSGTIDAYGQRQWSANDATRMMEKAGFADVAVTGLPKRYYRLQLIRAVKPA